MSKFTAGGYAPESQLMQEGQGPLGLSCTKPSCVHCCLFKGKISS